MNGPASKGAAPFIFGKHCGPAQLSGHSLRTWMTRPAAHRRLNVFRSHPSNSNRPMRTKTTIQKRQRPRRRRNEWLLVIGALDHYMARQAARKTTRMAKPLVDRDTLAALNTAYSVTLRYYAVLLGGASRSPEAQKAVSRLWQKAGARLKRYDPALARHLKVGCRFWSSAITWEKETIQKAWAHLNSIRTSSNMLDPEVGSIVRQFSQS